MKPAATIKAIVFDAYGTIFDVLSVSDLAEKHFPGRGAELSALWRVKQIDYTRLRTISERYVPFSVVTHDALIYSMRALGLPFDDDVATALMRQYDHLDVFSDAAEALVVLKGRGLPLAILSNGDPPMLEAVVANTGIAHVFDHLLSVDRVERFKTAAEAYALGPAAFGCRACEIVFVSSNCWDACGAAWHGYTTFWIDRAGMPVEELGIAPTATGRSMLDVVDFVATRMPRVA